MNGEIYNLVGDSLWKSGSATPDDRQCSPPHTSVTAPSSNNPHPSTGPSIGPRKGHRPVVTPSQALFLARELYGIHIGIHIPQISTASLQPICGSEYCTELPSYDDRNFRIIGKRKQFMRVGPRQQLRLRQGPAASTRGREETSGAEAAAKTEEGAGEERWQGLGGMLSCGVRLSPSCSFPGRMSSVGHAQQQQLEEEYQEEGRELHACDEDVDVVLKVHNSQDSGRTEQLQAMDAAMLRLQAAGVLTNTPLRPMENHPRLRRNNEDGCAGEAGADPWLSGGRSSTDVDGEVPYWVGTSLEQQQTSADIPPPCCCWALLPCTCCCNRPGADELQHQGQMGEGEGEIATLGRDAGDQETDEYLPSCHRHVVRCLSYVPGRMLSSVMYLHDVAITWDFKLSRWTLVISFMMNMTPALLQSLGRLMGRVTVGLSDWDAPLRHCNQDWHPENGAAVLKRLVPGLGAFDQECKSLLLTVADELMAAGPRLTDSRVFPRQACHADANDDNCVVSDDGGEVVGLIDFGDLAIMPRVCEVAITMLYAMLLGLQRPMGQVQALGGGAMTPDNPEGPKEVVGMATHSAAPVGQERRHGQTEGQHPHDQEHNQGQQQGQEEGEEAESVSFRRLLLIGGLVLCGYQSVVPLREEELAVLPLLLRGRLAQSLALGAASVVSDPDNAAYLLSTQRPGWRVIRWLTPGSVMTDEEALQHLLAAADTQSAGEEAVWA